MKKPGFTLVELLVVIAIIGMLMGLLLPAVQQAREAARQVQCNNNMKQHGTAFQTHNATHDGCFPSGGTGCTAIGDRQRDSGYNQRGGWTYSLLPFLEQTALHQSSIETRLSTPLPLFYCPSTRPPLLYLSLVRGAYSDSESHAGLERMAKCDYAANCGTGTQVEIYDIPSGKSCVSQAYYDYGGLVFNPQSINGHSELAGQFMVYEKDVYDGLSNTILVGERYLNLSFNEAATPAGGDDDCYLSGHNYDTLRCYGGGRLYQDRQNYGRLSEFGASHAGSVGFVMADGHHQQISYSVDSATLKKLMNRMDEEVIDWTGI